jgi:hypothetical protein
MIDAPIAEVSKLTKMAKPSTDERDVDLKRLVLKEVAVLVKTVWTGVDA